MKLEPTVTISGILEPFFETGTEGIIWSVHEDGVPGYPGLNCLEDGNQLVVFNQERHILWSGVIKLEYKRRFRSYPLNPAYGQQEVEGMWVHGFQENVDPEVWTRWFFNKQPCSLKRPRNWQDDEKVMKHELPASECICGLDPDDCTGCGF